jgi:hypothetical protein
MFGIATTASKLGCQLSTMNTWMTFLLIVITSSLHFISFLSWYLISNFILIFCHPGEMKIHMWLQTLCIGSTTLRVLANNQWSSSSLWCLKMMFELRRQNRRIIKSRLGSPLQLHRSPPYSIRFNRFHTLPMILFPLLSSSIFLHC